jgi:hypothetical protein
MPRDFFHGAGDLATQVDWWREPVWDLESGRLWAEVLTLRPRDGTSPDAWWAQQVAAGRGDDAARVLEGGLYLWPSINAVYVPLHPAIGPSAALLEEPPDLFPLRPPTALWTPEATPGLRAWRPALAAERIALTGDPPATAVWWLTLRELAALPDEAATALLAHWMQEALTRHARLIVEGAVGIHQMRRLHEWGVFAWHHPGGGRPARDGDDNPFVRPLEASV